MAANPDGLAVSAYPKAYAAAKFRWFPNPVIEMLIYKCWGAATRHGKISLLKISFEIQNENFAMQIPLTLSEVQKENRARFGKGT